METSRWIVLSLLVFLMIVSFLKVAYSLKDDKGFGWLFILFFITAFIVNILCNTLIVKSDLEKKLEAKCPQYEKIDNVYILKK